MLPKWCIASLTGAAPLVRGPGEYFEDVWTRPMLPVGACWEEKPEVVVVVGAWCTRSVGITPLLIGCIATYRVQRDVTGATRRNGCNAAWPEPVVSRRTRCQARALVAGRSGRHKCSPHLYARAVATCVNGAAGMRRRTTNRTNNTGGAQAVWLGPLPLLYERSATR